MFVLTNLPRYKKFVIILGLDTCGSVMHDNLYEFQPMRNVLIYFMYIIYICVYEDDDEYTNLAIDS